MCFDLSEEEAALVDIFKECGWGYDGKKTYNNQRRASSGVRDGFWFFKNARYVSMYIIETAGRLDIIHGRIRDNAHFSVYLSDPDCFDMLKFKLNKLAEFWE